MNYNSKDYKNMMRIFEVSNYIFLDEIKNFEFKKISKYNKSRHIYNKVHNDFILVNELLQKSDLLNGSIILRASFENITYLICTLYDRNIKISLDLNPRFFRKILKEKCNVFFSDYFCAEDFDYIYNYLSKLTHPSSFKEIMAYLNTKKQYTKYLLNNLKYMTLVIEFMYLDYLNKVLNNDNKMNQNLINFCSYANLVNIVCFANSMKESFGLIKKYFYYDVNSNFISGIKEEFTKTYELLLNNTDCIKENINRIGMELENQISDSKYKYAITDLINTH